RRDHAPRINSKGAGIGAGVWRIRADRSSAGRTPGSGRRPLGSRRGLARPRTSRASGGGRLPRRAPGSWRPPQGGARGRAGPRGTWSFDLRDADGTIHGLVLRRDPGAHVGQSDRATEYALLTAAASAGVPVPHVRFLLEPDDELGRGFVMDRVEGETIARRIL